MAALMRVTRVVGLTRTLASRSGPFSRPTSVRLNATQNSSLSSKRSYGTEAPVGGTISSCSQHGDCVVLHWGASPQHHGPWSKYHFFWLRDNCMCPQCYHPDTNQRLVDAITVPMDLKPRQLELMKDSGLLRVEWEDGHVSEYPAAWLMRNSYESEGLDSVREQPGAGEDVILWGKEIAGSPPEVEYSKVMQNDRELLECLRIFKKYGFCFIKGTPASASGSRELIETMFGVIRTTFYGSFWDHVSTASFEEPSDTAYTNLAIAAHTDGNYFSEAPGLEVFHCLQFDGTGGQSALVDGFKIAEEIRKKSPHHFKVLSTIPLTYHFTDNKHRLVNSNPVFVLDGPSGQVKRVHFNDADRLPLNSAQVESLQQLGMAGERVSPMHQLYESMREFIKTSRDESLVYRFQLEPGRLLLFNNHRLLHARTAFTGVREMAGCYVNKEDYDSKVAVLSKKYNI